MSQSKSKFVTNKEGKNTLKKRISNIMDSTESVDILVGFFYFSGFSELYNGLKDKKVRILVGKDIEKEITNRDKYYKKLVDTFNSNPSYDNKNSVDAFNVYRQKLENGTLEVRMTSEPNHAKLYIFNYLEEKNNNGEDIGRVITGSSNFTASGLQHQHEIDVILNDSRDVEEGQAIFDELWENADKILDKNRLDNFRTQVMDKIWIGQNPSPYLMYLRVLDEYFSIKSNGYIETPSEITNSEFTDLKYQIDAIKMAIQIINAHNGVLIADVVGLGKSIIASTVAKHLNLRVIIIAPPHLVKQWEDYKNAFKFNSLIIESRGKLDKVIVQYHKQVERDNEEKFLVIIDEAHTYRNENTYDYACLHNICLGNKVMLLTATPFNNRPADVFAMLKFFQIPAQSTIQAIERLGDEFYRLTKEYDTLKKEQKDKKIDKKKTDEKANQISKQIRELINPVIIRRSRLDLDIIPSYREDLLANNMEFAKVAPPELLEYDLGEIAELYYDTLQWISFKQGTEGEDISLLSGFKAARFMPSVYCKEERRENLRDLLEKEYGDYFNFREGQKNMGNFMRRMLVQRFESSQAAFKLSIERMVENYKKYIEWIGYLQAAPMFKRGGLPDVEGLLDYDADMELEEIPEYKNLKERGLIKIPLEYLNKDFMKDVTSDYNHLKELQEKWNKIDIDPKLDSFVKIIKEKLKKEPDRKIVVFSQYKDTVESVFDELKSSE
ncbi:MAG: phospholipase D-like domain-containing protein [Ignavibacteria bacterium]|jgi:superfamily II DNA or RNA helicase|nr:phospholipase D-like domain-containing protein [Ignavibacteria bacterium]